LRVILLCLYGGIYCDFNDTICFFPMEYLITLYQNEYFMGTDYDIEHPIYRNNYLIYTSYNNQQFNDLSMECINLAAQEHIRITSINYMEKYYDVCADFLHQLNQCNTLPTTETCLVNMLIGLDTFKEIIKNDSHKDNVRLIRLLYDVMDYLCYYLPTLKNVSRRLIHELEYLDINCLKNNIIQYKRNRRKWQSLNECELPVVYDLEKINSLTHTFQYYDYFLLKYGSHMTPGDLILSTNIAYIGKVKNLIPYSRFNRLSTISMIAHVYDGTSYGLTKSYDVVDPLVEDLRKEFL
jgi:hypothetical protein